MRRRRAGGANRAGGLEERVGIGRALAAGGLALLALGVLADAGAVADGVRAGLTVCGEVLIPSLFPFMALCCFLSLTEYARILSIPLTPLTTRWFRLPAEFGVIVLLSLIGGYPVGAKMIANLLAQGRIDRETAGRMLCFCVNASPSFLISAVGAGMLGSRRLGVILFAAQVLATLLVGGAVSRRCPRPARVRVSGGTARGGVEAFVAAVSDASGAMIGMCAFAVLFSTLLALIGATGLIGGAAGLLSLDENMLRAAVSGLFEVTTGSLNAAALGGAGGVVMLSLCASFGGLSVLCQVISFFGEGAPGFGRMLLARLAHCAVGAALTLGLLGLFGGEVSVWAPVVPAARGGNGRTLVISLCLLCMCSMLVLATGGRGEKE